MGESSLILVPVVVRPVVKLGLVSESVATVALQQILIPLLEILLQINLAGTLFKLAVLTSPPVVRSAHTCYFY